MIRHGVPSTTPYRKARPLAVNTMDQVPGRGLAIQSNSLCVVLARLSGGGQVPFDCGGGLTILDGFEVAGFNFATGDTNSPANFIGAWLLD